MRDANLSGISSRLALVVAASEAMVAPAERATEMFERALQLPDADRWPFDLARVQLAFGEHLRRVRAITDARVHLDAAVTTFDLFGARPWSARAVKESRATGVGTPAAGGGTAEALTAQELEVASLAAAGLTNRQIGEQLYMSPRTVGAHLYRVFPKLGVTSRAALRDALDRYRTRTGQQFQLTTARRRSRRCDRWSRHSRRGAAGRPAAVGLGTPRPPAGTRAAPPAVHCSTFRVAAPLA